MNKAILMGRLTKDPELRTTQSNISVCSFTLACDRRYKNADGTRSTDFIPCVAWRQQAEFATRYFHKGDRMLVMGTIQPRSWEDQQTGQRRYITEVIVDEIYFCESKRSSGEGQYDQGGGNTYRSGSSQSGGSGGKGFLPDPDEDEHGLPFDMI